MKTALDAQNRIRSKMLLALYVISIQFVYGMCLDAIAATDNPSYQPNDPEEYWRKMQSPWQDPPSYKLPSYQSKECETRNNVNVRKGPSIKHEIISTLPKKSKIYYINIVVDEEDSEKNWVSIEIENETGYIAWWVLDCPYFA